MAFSGTLTVWMIDGATANSREVLFSLLAVALQFPVYIGRNWDATSDCFRDLAGGDSSRSVLIITNCDQFPAGISAE